MKKYFYIFSWLVLGLMLSLLGHAGFEMALIDYGAKNDIILTNYTSFGYGYCVLPTYVQIALWVGGLLLGVVAGPYFWRVLYVEKRYESKLAKFFEKKKPAI